MFKSTYSRLSLIAAVFIVSVLIALPRIPLVSEKYNIDSFIGGYHFRVGTLEFDFSEYKKGLDIEGGVRVVLKANMDKIDEVDREDALEAARGVIDRRVNLLGVSEPYVATSRVGNEYRILVEIPGITDVASAVELIGQTAQLSFKVVSDEVEWGTDITPEELLSPTFWTETNLTGADLKGALVVFSQGQGTLSTEPQIQLLFTNEGRDKFSEIVKTNINKPVGIFLDNSAFPLSMPIVSPDLANGIIDDPVISGNFDVESANSLSIQLKAGALPVPVEILEQKTIGATLGQESIEKSIFAGAVGLALVAVFMVFAYGWLGFLADIALFIYTLVVLAIFKSVPVVLTLPGIAGFVLSIGMATDANVLIFERIKEEILWGKPKSLAISLGFERAWTSIKDSNISSLLTAFVLFQFGSGPVKGFALTLAIGILVSLFTSIYVVRTLIEVFGIGKIKISKGENK